MSHDFKPELHEKAMIDVMLKRNTTPEWVYKFNKFLIDERTTGEIIKFTDELLHQELQKARAEAWQEAVNLADKIELREPDGGTKQWMAFKAFRNTLRDKMNQSELDQHHESHDDRGAGIIRAEDLS